ncbi:MAG: hypothetical protein LBU77_03905, partial [Clostridiales bacterium]|nr:hypothetical protein [Clostridiales bacterium]
GDSAALSFSGISKNGRSFPLDSASMAYEVVPAGLGAVNAGVFTANRAGAGYIKCALGGAVSYIPVYATLSTALISDFEARPNVMGFGYPGGAKGVLQYTDKNVTSGKTAVSLDYTFPASTETQAAYAMFEPKIAIGGKAAALKLSVFGDQSHHWLRGKIFDATGKDYAVDFAKAVDWQGWKEVTAQVPADVVYPITVERIYVASLSETAEVKHSIYFDDLKALIEADVPSVALPAASAFADYLQYTPETAPAGGFDITLMPSIYYTNGKNDDKPENYLADRQKAMQALFKNSSRSIYLYNEDFQEEAGKRIKYNNGQYTTETLSSVLLIGMNSQSGSFMKSDVTQWGKIKNDIMKSPVPNVVIYTDANPFRFAQQKEFELFHEMLLECQKAGKTIFVVSDEWINNSNDLVDGIRYINLAQYYRPDGKINDDFSILRLRVNGNELKYCIDKLAK